MIAKWDGRCSICKGAIPAGEDVHYDAEAKSVQHWTCYENPQPSPEQVALAERLGYREYDWEELLKVTDQPEQENPCSTNSTKPPN